MEWNVTIETVYDGVKSIEFSKHYSEVTLNRLVKSTKKRHTDIQWKTSFFDRSQTLKLSIERVK